jgi:hypothetical protein
VQRAQRSQRELNPRFLIASWTRWMHNCSTDI